MESRQRSLVETENTYNVRLQPPPRHVMFTEDTIDNEEMNKKKSNICCIYRKKRTNPEDSSCSSSSEDEKNDYEYQPKYNNSNK
ncbi:unnamed protein product [Blepharisma stoltei]|uniref:Protein phosphatase 1 regulatory subunit 11 n=1 Tax=Blepharisma stoltei TaxID=1481888 RepID=A0AAU9IEU1_9CILI|nr:unnamed protein product [Blepharisma stoltei]